MHEFSQEKPEDYWEVEALFDLCFAPGREALSSYRLRDGVAPVAELCLVARVAGGVLAGAVLIGALSYYGITYAMRVGEIGFVTPFRYSRMIFALIIGMAFFNENPDALTLTGASIIILSGLYTLWREQNVKRRAAA